MKEKTLNGRFSLKGSLNLSFYAVMVGILFGTIFLSLPWNSLAQVSFPNKPVSMVVWSSPGGGGDIFARTIKGVCDPYISHPFLVLNKPGGGTAIGRTFVGKSKPDGYTVLSATGNLTLTPFVAAKEYDYRAFDPIIRLVVNDAVIAVRTEAPWNNLADLIKDAAAGKRLIIGGTTDIAGNDGIVGFQLAKAGKFKLNWVLYDGAGEMTAALLGGHVDVAIGDPSTFLGHVESKRVKIVAVASNGRSEYFPGVSTAKEQGLDIVWEDYRGFLAPKGTPKDIVKVLHDSFRKAFDESSFKGYLKQTGQKSAYLGSDEFRQYLAGLSVHASNLLKEIGVIK